MSPGEKKIVGCGTSASMKALTISAIALLREPDHPKNILVLFAGSRWVLAGFFATFMKQSPWRARWLAISTQNSTHNPANPRQVTSRSLLQVLAQLSDDVKVNFESD
jgi:hypothetical protein